MTKEEIRQLIDEMIEAQLMGGNGTRFSIMRASVPIATVGIALYFALQLLLQVGLISPPTDRQSALLAELNHMVETEHTLREGDRELLRAFAENQGRMVEILARIEERTR